MRRLLFALLLAMAPFLVAPPVLAVQPDEVLDDPVLEARARELSKGLRCLVCRNESIDDSNAELARDLRLLVRERIVAGDSNDEAIAFIVARYGEYVLLKPTTEGANKVLWIAGPLMLLIALGTGAGYLRKRGQGAQPQALSDDEQLRLDQLLKE